MWKWWTVLRDEEEGGGAGGGGGVPGVGPDRLDALAQEIQMQRRQTEQFMQMMAASGQQQQQVQQQQVQQEDIDRQFWAKPAQSAQQIAAAVAGHVVQQAMGAQMQATHDTLVSVARDKAREMVDPELFDRYRAEIEREVMQVQPVQFQQNANVWKLAAERIIGSHFRDLMREEREKAAPPKGPAIKVSDGPAAPSPRPGPAPKVEALSEDAQRVARKLRITDEQMRKGLEMYQNQNDGDPNKPSSWDHHITFDQNTGQARREKERRKASAA